MDATRRRHAALEPGDRRAADPRGVAERDGDRTRPAQREDGLAGADGGQGRVVAGRRRGHGLLRLARRPPLRRPRRQRPDPLGVPDRRSHQREPVRVRRTGVRHDIRGLLRLPRPEDGRGAVDDVPQARRLPLRELLCEPVHRRRSSLLRREDRHGLRGRRVERPDRVDARRSAVSATPHPPSPKGGSSPAASTGGSARSAQRRRGAVEHIGRTAASSARPS